MSCMTCIFQLKFLFFRCLGPKTRVFTLTSSVILQKILQALLQHLWKQRSLPVPLLPVSWASGLWSILTCINLLLFLLEEFVFNHEIKKKKKQFKIHIMLWCFFMLSLKLLQFTQTESANIKWQEALLMAFTYANAFSKAFRKCLVT